MSGFIGSGDLYFDRLDDSGNSTGGFILIGNATKLELKPDSDTKDRVSRQRDTYGQVLDSISLPKPTKISLSVDELQLSNLAIAMLGTVVEVSSTSGSVSPGSVGIGNFTAGQPNIWQQLPNTYISNVVLKSADEVVEYVIGEDYNVNERLGLVETFGDTINPDDELRISYSYSVPAQFRIDGSTQSVVKGKIKLDGVNRVNGQPVIVEIDEAVLSPKSAIDFLADKFLELSLEGVCRTLPGKTSPYTVTLG